MARTRGSNSRGGGFSESEINAVWSKGTAIQGYSDAEWRRDICGQPIQRSAYGNTNSKYGWEIDHIKPVSKGGGDELANLQPLYWATNRDKADTEPWRCP